MIIGAVSESARVPSIIRVLRDEYIYYVLLDDLRCYVFDTVHWPEHGLAVDFERVGEAAKTKALAKALRDRPTWRLKRKPVSKEEFAFIIDELCKRTSESEFNDFLKND